MKPPHRIAAAFVALFQGSNAFQSIHCPLREQHAVVTALHAGSTADHSVPTGSPLDRTPMDRRTAVAVPLASCLALSLGSPALAGALSQSSSSPLTASDQTTLAPVTHKVVMDVRISRQDGTFYVRDDLEDTPENRVFYGKLTLGLFGTTAPNNVQQFLKFANVTYLPLDDNPLPSYSRSNFVSLDQSTGKPHALGL